jgi:hypothetical protein
LDVDKLIQGVVAPFEERGTSDRGEDEVDKDASEAGEDQKNLVCDYTSALIPAD